MLLTHDAHRIWKRPEIKYTPVFPLQLDEALPEESTTPYEILVWAEYQPELRKLSRVTAYTPQNPTDATGKLILGLRAEFVKGYIERDRYVGGHGRDWPEDAETTCFDLYGPNGESIAEIGIPKDGTLNGVMVCAALAFPMTPME